MSADLNCKEVSRLISAGLDAELPQAERARLRLHFAVCTACRNVEQQFSFLRRAVRGLDNSQDEPAPVDPARQDPKPR